LNIDRPANLRTAPLNQAHVVSLNSTCDSIPNFHHKTDTEANIIFKLSGAISPIVPRLGIDTQCYTNTLSDLIVMLLVYAFVATYMTLILVSNKATFRRHPDRRLQSSDFRRTATSREMMPSYASTIIPYIVFMMSISSMIGLSGQRVRGRYVGRRTLKILLYSTHRIVVIGWDIVAADLIFIYTLFPDTLSVLHQSWKGSRLATRPLLKAVY
jgi:hypothetical protein